MGEGEVGDVRVNFLAEKCYIMTIVKREHSHLLERIHEDNWHYLGAPTSLNRSSTSEHECSRCLSLLAGGVVLTARIVEVGSELVYSC